MDDENDKYEAKWVRSSVCPMDALSLNVRQKGRTQWREFLALVIEWDRLRGTGFPAIINLVPLDRYRGMSVDEIAC
jgi:hypothetical protein